MKSLLCNILLSCVPSVYTNFFLFRAVSLIKMRHRAKESGTTTSICLFQNLLAKKQIQCFLTLLVATGRYSGAVFDIFL